MSCAIDFAPPVRSSIPKHDPLGTLRDFDRVFGCRVDNAEFNYTSLVTECLNRLRKLQIASYWRYVKGQGATFQHRHPFL